MKCKVRLKYELGKKLMGLHKRIVISYIEMIFNDFRQSFYLVYANEFFRLSSKVITSMELQKCVSVFACLRLPLNRSINGRTSVCRGLCCAGRRLFRSWGAGDDLQPHCPRSHLLVAGSACFIAIVTYLSANGDDAHCPVSSKLRIIGVVGPLSCF